MSANQYCSVPQCSSWSKKNSELSFHLFPTAEEYKTRVVNKVAIQELVDLTPELQAIAKNELGEEPTRIAEDLKNIREWLLTQHHLNCRTDDQWLISFLRGCKFNIENTKIKIDNYHRMKTLMPEFFENRDPFQPEIQEFLKAGLVLPLPITTEGSERRIIYNHFSGIPHTKINFILVLKIYTMFLDVLILEDDNLTVAGLVAWTDCEEFPLSYLIQITPNLIRKVVYCFQHCYPIRIKKNYSLNAPLAFEILFNLMKSFMSIKLRNRFFVYGKQKSKQLDLILDQKYMPQQRGGTNGSMDELTEYWKNKIESYRDWFLEDGIYRSNENLRPEKSTSTNILFNMLGSINPFRKF